MNKLLLIITILVAIFYSLYVGKTTLTTNPFHFEIERPWTALLLFATFIAMILEK